MAIAPSPLTFDTAFAPDTGAPVPIAPGVVRVTAGNSGPYTFTGTNTFLLGESRLAVVDPGPADAQHLEALHAAIGGRVVDAILLTHTHRDHSDLARPLRAAVGAPIWFAGRHRPSRRPGLVDRIRAGREADRSLVPDRVLIDGETLELDGLRLEVVATPGHCANHVCIGIAGTPWLLSGDHVMGWNSTMIAPPDGSMADYLDSLRKVIALSYDHYLPAHGGPIEMARGYAGALLAHRELRNEEIVAAVSKGAKSIGELRRTIYPKLPAQLIPAALMTLAAHAEYLDKAGRIRARRGLGGLKLEPRR